MKSSKEKPLINFTLNVIANDVNPNEDGFECKVVVDFAPPFNGGSNSDWQGFHANKVRKILNFISDRVVRKVVEAVYYDRGVATFDKAKKTYTPINGLKLPYKYKEAMDIYNERRTEYDKLQKDKRRKNDKSYLDIKERKSPEVGTNCIECIIKEFLKDADRPVWSKEGDVTRITFEQQSPPSLTVETRTSVNGDKKPK